VGALKEKVEAETSLSGLNKTSDTYEKLLVQDALDELKTKGSLPVLEAAASGGGTRYILREGSQPDGLSRSPAVTRELKIENISIDLTQLEKDASADSAQPQQKQ
jgi:hypothetical protein